ncbi:MAG: hypothetical protein AAGA15_02955 [Pseudomonadota bacterium]
MSGTLKAGGALAVIWAVMAFVSLWPGGLAVTLHEGDTLHFIDITERMARGQLPHVDFETPIGGGAFWPIAALVQAGLSMGAAYLVAQVILGALFGALAVAVAATRVDWGWTLAFGLLVLSLTMSFVHGEASLGISISMHYNRWAWALSFIVLLMAILPSESNSKAFDGIVLGAAMAALLLIKVTYFAVLAPLVIIALLLTAQRMVLGIGLVFGLFLTVVLTAFVGVDYWLAYLGDLLAVVGSDVRPQPGLNLSQIFSAPAYVAYTAVAFAMVVVLRRSGFLAEGLFVLLLIGAGAYITYQNFGNDPVWFALLALLLGVWASEASARGPRPALTLGAVALAAGIAPSIINMAGSPVRHLTIDREEYIPALVGTDVHQDFLMNRKRANLLRAEGPLERGSRGFDAPEAPEVVMFQGEELTDCMADVSVATYGSLAADLAEQGLAQGSAIYMMDILNPIWLLGDHEPLLGGTPWYYDGLPGFENAQFVLLPLCPVNPMSQRLMVEAMAELSDVSLTEVARRPLYILYAR